MLKARRLLPAGLERDHEQKREQNLNSDGADADLLDHLRGVAIEPLLLSFVPAVVGRCGGF